MPTPTPRPSAPPKATHFVIILTSSIRDSFCPSLDFLRIGWWSIWFFSLNIILWDTFLLLLVVANCSFSSLCNSPLCDYYSVFIDLTVNRHLNGAAVNFLECVSGCPVVLILLGVTQIVIVDHVVRPWLRFPDDGDGRTGRAEVCPRPPSSWARTGTWGYSLLVQFVWALISRTHWPRDAAESHVTHT